MKLSEIIHRVFQFYAWGVIFLFGLILFRCVQIAIHGGNPLSGFETAIFLCFSIALILSAWGILRSWSPEAVGLSLAFPFVYVFLHTPAWNWGGQGIIDGDGWWMLMFYGAAFASFLVYRFVVRILCRAAFPEVSNRGLEPDGSGQMP